MAGTAATPSPLVLHGAPSEANEWRLVVDQRAGLERPQARRSVARGGPRRIGRRWSSSANPGSGSPARRSSRAGSATVTGIVRRPYPNASDRRFAITPRVPGGRDGRRPAPAAVVTPTGSSVRGRRFRARARRATAAPAIDADDADLGDLAAFVGRIVRVGGLVVDLRADGFTLDDGTAIGRRDPAGAALDSLAADRTRRRPQRRSAGSRQRLTARSVVVDDPGGISWPAIRSPRPRRSPAAASAAVAGASAGRPARRGAGRRRVSAVGGLPVDAGTAGLGTLVAISAASVARDPAPPGAVASPAGEPDRRPAGHARRPQRRPSTTATRG